MMIGNGPAPRVGYSIETSTSLLRVVSRSNADGMTPTGDEPMSNAYDGAYDAGCGAGVVFCCGDDEHPAAAMIASASAIRFMKPPCSLHLNAKTGDRISARGESGSSLRKCWRKCRYSQPFSRAIRAASTRFCAPSLLIAS